MNQGRESLPTSCRLHAIFWPPCIIPPIHIPQNTPRRGQPKQAERLALFTHEVSWILSP